MMKARIASITAENDAWRPPPPSPRRRTLSRRKVLFAQMRKLGSSQTASGWVVSTIVWGWVSSRAEQAATEGLDVERAIRVTKLTPNPWDIGAVRAILPELVKSCAGFDWTKPANAWSKDVLAEFLLASFTLIQRAVAARDIWGAYGAAKAALRHMTAIWAEEARDEGVRFLSLDPGDMDTPLHAMAVPDADPATLKRPEDAAREIVASMLGALLDSAPLALSPRG
jgi:NAD(P)-dependent dehydrogenase (short-subunit alcohol dehydrogenase family)